MKNIILNLIVLVSLNAKCQVFFNVAEYKIDLRNYPAYSQQELEKAILEVKNSPYFDYHYLNSGCNDKSHYISLWLNKKHNIQTFKVWNFAKNIVYYGGWGIQLKIKDPNLLTQNDTLYWGFHVATATLRNKKINKKTVIDTVVIDLPFNDISPIKLDTWLSLQNQANTYYTFTEKKYRLFETIVPGYYNNNVLTPLKSSTLFAGSFYDDSFALSDENKVTANALARDIVIMKYYNNEIKPKMLNDGELQQLLQQISQWGKYEAQRASQLKGQGKSEQEVKQIISDERNDLLNRIRAKRYTYTKDISDINNISLPEQYNTEIIELTDTIQNHIKNDLLK